MDRRMLSSEEREEYDALLQQAGYDDAGSRRPSGEIGDHMHELLVDAVRAGRTWAGYVVDDDARTGHLARFKRWDKVRHIIHVEHQSVIVPRAAVMGVKRRNVETGAVYHQQVLFTEMSWDELIGTLDSAHARIASERITVDTCLKLLALKHRAPESLGPQDACDQLGLDMEEYLLEAAA